MSKRYNERQLEIHPGCVEQEAIDDLVANLELSLDDERAGRVSTLEKLDVWM